MGLSLAEFKAHVTDVARPNRFLIQIPGFGNSIGGNGSLDLTASVLPELVVGLEYYAKSVSIPERTIGQFDIGWQGMRVKLAGDPSFSEITAIFHNDYEGKARWFFERWADFIATMDTNERASQAGYKTDSLYISQLGRADSEILSQYVLEGAWAKSVSTIDLDFDTNDNGETFSVTFDYDKFTRVI